MPLCSTGHSDAGPPVPVSTGNLWDTLRTQHWGEGRWPPRQIDLDRYVDILELFPARVAVGCIAHLSVRAVLGDEDCTRCSHAG